MNAKRALINWKVVFILLLLIVCIGIIIYITTFYRTLVDSKVENRSAIASFVLESNLLKTIEEIDDVQAEERFYIVKGTDKKQIERLIFIPHKEDVKEKDVLKFKTKDLRKQEDIETSWQKECNGCSLKKSNPSMIEKKPLWELAYTDASNRYIIQYISLEDGKIYEQLTLNKKYE